jgi:hypothetical protein
VREVCRAADKIVVGRDENASEVEEYGVYKEFLLGVMPRRRVTGR